MRLFFFILSRGLDTWVQPPQAKRGCWRRLLFDPGLRACNSWLLRSESGSRTLFSYHLESFDIKLKTPGAHGTLLFNTSKRLDYHLRPRGGGVRRLLSEPGLRACNPQLLSSVSSQLGCATACYLWWRVALYFARWSTSTWTCWWNVGSRMATARLMPSTHSFTPSWSRGVMLRCEGGRARWTSSPTSTSSSRSIWESTGVSVWADLLIPVVTSNESGVEMEGSRLPITQTASANQNVTNKTLHGKPKEWPPCLSGELKA